MGENGVKIECVGCKVSMSKNIIEVIEGKVLEKKMEIVNVKI